MQSMKTDNWLGMIKDCVMSASEMDARDGGPNFTDWELEFLDSLEDQLLDGKSPTPKQRATLTDLWSRS